MKSVVFWFMDGSILHVNTTETDIENLDNAILITDEEGVEHTIYRDKIIRSEKMDRKVEF